MTETMNAAKGRPAITWLGQMGLRVEIGETTILVDYFASDLEGRRIPAPIPTDEVRGVDAFLGTHDHIDHIDHGAWRVWAKTCPGAKFVFPSVHRQSVLDDGVAEAQLLPIDAALLPINGRDGARYRVGFIGNMTFQEAVDVAGELGPKLALPGHWDMFAENPGDPAAFADYLDAKYAGRVACRIRKVLERITL